MQTNSPSLASMLTLSSTGTVFPPLLKSMLTQSTFSFVSRDVAANVMVAFSI